MCSEVLQDTLLSTAAAVIAQVRCMTPDSCSCCTTVWYKPQQHCQYSIPSHIPSELLVSLYVYKHNSTLWSACRASNKGKGQTSNQLQHQPAQVCRSPISWCPSVLGTFRLSCCHTAALLSKGVTKWFATDRTAQHMVMLLCRVCAGLCWPVLGACCCEGLGTSTISNSGAAVQDAHIQG
jgi:VanZ family protein